MNEQRDATYSATKAIAEDVIREDIKACMKGLDHPNLEWSKAVRLAADFIALVTTPSEIAPKWVPVDERLPEMGTVVLAIHLDKHLVGPLLYAREGFISRLPDSNVVHRNIAFWQPFAAPGDHPSEAPRSAIGQKHIAGRQREADAQFLYKQAEEGDMIFKRTATYLADLVSKNTLVEPK